MRALCTEAKWDGGIFGDTQALPQDEGLPRLHTVLGPWAQSSGCAPRARVSRVLTHFGLAGEEEAAGVGAWGLGAWVGTVGNEPAIICTCRMGCTRDLTLGNYENIL